MVGLLTEGHGKISGLAKGSKRMSPGAVARFSGGIELLTLGQIVGVIKPSAELATLTEWDLQQPFFHLRRDLAAQRLAMYAADLAHAMIADHDAHPASFTALSHCLSGLADPAGRDAALLCYQWALLADCGYRPQIECDAQTGKELADQATYVFDAQSGGITCEKSNSTAQDDAGPWRVRRETVAVLRAAAHGHVEAAPPVVRRANRLLCVYARAILDRQLPTMALVLDPA